MSKSSGSSGNASGWHPNFVISDPTLWKGKWNESFGNDHPIHIEIGMGKGEFITGMAKAHPEINDIGVEMQIKCCFYSIRQVDRTTAS